MSQPLPYERTTDFTERDGDDTNHVALNAELDAAALTIQGLRVNLALIQRDDGKFKDGSIEPSHFSAASLAMMLATKWNPRGLWVTARNYAVNDMVDVGGASYVCAVDHLSGVFAADYASGKWQVFSSIATAATTSFTPSIGVTSNSVQAAIEEVDTRSRRASLPILSAFFGGF